MQLVREKLQMGYSLALPAEDKALIDEYVHGDRDAAATRFVRQHQRFVYSLALRQLGQSHDDADDAAQEVFIRALKGLETFKGDSSMQTWLYRITVNVCHTMRRKSRLLSWFGSNDDDQLDMVSPDATPERALLNKDFQLQFEQMLQQLPEKQRETFYLRYFDELSYEEISEILGTSIGGLKANYFQAVQKLARLIQTSDFLERKD